MVFKIRGFDNKVFHLVAHELTVTFVKVCVVISPLAVWQIYELIKPYLEG